MRKSPILFLLLAAALTLALPGAVLADDCWLVCNSSVPCDTECGWDPGKGGPVTCGEQGLPCNEGGGLTTTPSNLDFLFADGIVLVDTTLPAEGS